MTISTSSVLVDLNISVWTANKLDKSATDSVLIHNRATTTDAAQVRKNLMAGTSARKKIADYAAGCRLWHNVHTLPWSDKGTRLLPTSLFMDYKHEANVRQGTFDKMVDEFIADYPQLVKVAEASMGSLFDPNDYPSAEEVRSKFGFRLVFSPVPDAGDFRLDIPQQELDEVRKSYEVNANERVERAMKEQWEKLHDMLTGMSAKLTASDDDTKRRWHDTFVTNAQDLCQMLTHLNITRDPKLEAARRQLEHAMFGTSIEAIKEDETSRSDLKQKLDAILKEFEW